MPRARSADMVTAHMETESSLAGGCQPHRDSISPETDKSDRWVLLTMDGRSNEALQTKEQDLPGAAREVAELPEDMTGRVDKESLMGEGKDLAEHIKKAMTKRDTSMAALKCVSLKISRRRPPTERFISLLI